MRKDRSRRDIQIDIKIVKIDLREQEISFFEKVYFFLTLGLPSPRP